MASSAMWRVLGTGSAVLSATVAKKTATATWKFVTGNEPPANPEDPDTTWREAVFWAIGSGALIGLARLLATRAAADYWRRSTGELPPGLEKVT